MPKSRYSTTKFIKIIKQFFEEKQEAIIGLGFRELLKLGCTELRSGLCVTPQKYPRIFIIILLYIPGMN